MSVALRIFGLRVSRTFEFADGVNTRTLSSSSERCHLCSTNGIALTVTAGAVEALHGGVLRLPVRKLQRGVQRPKAFSQGVVLVVLDELLDTQTQRFLDTSNNMHLIVKCCCSFFEIYLKM